MIKWKNKLGKAIVLALSVGLLGNMASLSALASEASPSNSPESGNGTVIISFDSLENNSLELPVGGKIEDIRNRFPTTLTGKRAEASDATAVSGTKDSISGASNIIHVMTQNYAQGTTEENVDIAFDGWALKNGGSLDSSKAGETYEYVPVLLKQDREGHTLTYLNRPTVSVTIVGADNGQETGEVSDGQQYSENNSNGGIMPLAEGDTDPATDPDEPGFNVDKGNENTGSGQANGLWIAYKKEAGDTQKKPVTYYPETGTFTLDTSNNAEFIITGQWAYEADKMKNGADIITVEGNGKSTIWLKDVKIDISNSAFGDNPDNPYLWSQIINVKSGATVDLRVIDSSSDGTVLTCQENNAIGQRALNVEGNLNFLQGDLTLKGRFGSSASGKVVIGGNRLKKCDLIVDCTDTEKDPVENAGNLTVKYNGKLHIAGDVSNTGTLIIDGSREGLADSDKVEDPVVSMGASIDNRGTWTIKDNGKVYVKEKIVNNSTIKVTNNSILEIGKSENGSYGTCEFTNNGEITIDNGSKLLGKGALENSGSLSIDRKDCIGSDITLGGDGEFIFKGVPDDILAWKDGATAHRPDGSDPLLSYTGESQKDTIFHEEIGLLAINKTTQVNKVDFEIDAKKRIVTKLYRKVDGEDKVEEITSPEPGQIKEPGRYVIICENLETGKEDQKAMASFSMRSWSMEMTFTTERSAEPVGPDDYATENNFTDIDAVFEHESQINVKVKAAIFPERGKDGQIQINHEICKTVTNSKPVFENYLEAPLKIALDKTTGCGAAELNIRTADRKTFMPVPYTQAIDPTIEEPTSDEAATDADGVVRYKLEVPYKNPYAFKAKYVDAGGNNIYQEPIYTTSADGTVGLNSLSPSSTSWIVDKKVAVKRAKVRITFGENYYKSSVQYNREKLENPDTSDTKSISFEGFSSGSVKVDYVWYKEVDAAHEILEGNATGNLEEYYAVTEDYAEEQTEIDKGLVNYDPEKYLVAGGPPRDAGDYFVQAIVRETCKTFESWNTHPVTITPAPIKMQAVDQQKVYGEKDPDWGIVIEGTAEKPQTVSIQGTVYEGDSLNGCRLTRTKGEDQGSYDIGKENGFFNRNYDVDFTGGRLTIMPRDLRWNDKNTILAVDKNNLNKLYGGLQIDYVPHDGKDPDPNNENGIAQLFANDIKNGRLKVTYHAVTLDMTGESVGAFATISGVSIDGAAAKNYTLPIDNRVSLENANKNYELQFNKISALSGEDYGSYGEEVMSRLLIYRGIKDTGEIEALLKEDLRSKGVAEENMELYDIVIRQKDSTILKDITQVFPGSLTLILPYPAGTASTGYRFYAGHMITQMLDEGLYEPGYIESATVSATDAGVQFTLTSLSPVSLGWRTMAQNPNGGNTNNPDDGNNGNDTNDPNGNNNNNNNNDDKNNNKDNNNNKATSSNTNKATSSNTNKTTGTTTTNRTGSSGNGTSASSTITRALGAVTGDNAPIVLYAVLTFVGMALLLLIIVMLKKTFSGKK